jgi:hypothetical protein
MPVVILQSLTTPLKSIRQPAQVVKLAFPNAIMEQYPGIHE